MVAAWLLQCDRTTRIVTIDFRYTVVQHFIGLEYIVALPIID